MKYWLYDPDDGVTFFDDEDEFHKAAGGVVESYYDPAEGWSEDVRGVCGGVITHRAVVEAYLPRPPDEEIDEDGCDPDGTWWDPDWRAMVGFKWLPVDEKDADEENNHA